MPVVIGSWFIVNAALGIAERFASSRSAVATVQFETGGWGGKGREGEEREGGVGGVKDALIDLGCKSCEVIACSCTPRL